MINGMFMINGMLCHPERSEGSVTRERFLPPVEMTEGRSK